MSESSFEKNFDKAMAAAGVESSNSFYSLESEGDGSYLITATDPAAKQEFFGWGSGDIDGGWRYGQPSKVQRTTRGHRSHNLDYQPHEWHVTKGRAEKLIRDIKTNPATGKEAAPEKELLKLLAKIVSGTASSHAKKKAASAKSGKADTSKDKSIIEGMAKLAWAMRWADEEEAKEDGENFSGVDIYDAAPKPPKKAFDWAKSIGAEIAKDNGLTLTALYEKAKAAGFPNDAESFGADLSHKANGSGVDWNDRLTSANRFDIKVPRKEFYY